jgi:predicted lactoylglutathione lyase
MTLIQSVTLDATDPDAASAFYARAFGLGPRVGVRPADGSPSGFRGFTLSLVAAQPADVDALVAAALAAGATEIKPVKKSFWGYGGVVQAPDGAIWKIATSSKKNTGPASTRVDQVVLLLGVDDVKASKRFYEEQGLAVAKAFGGKYVEFDTDAGGVKLALYGRKALAKDAGVPDDGSGPHGLTIDSAVGRFDDPDGFAWQAA